MLLFCMCECVCVYMASLVTANTAVTIGGLMPAPTQSTYTPPPTHFVVRTVQSCKPDPYVSEVKLQTIRRPDSNRLTGVLLN